MSALVVLWGCSGDETHPRHSFEVATNDGVLTAITTGGPKYTSPVFSFRELLRLKQDESNPESIIVNGGDYLMHKSGSFYVPDYADMRFMIFDSQGNYLRSFGQQGSGPGDFNYPYLVRTDGDRLVIYDGVNRRSSHHRPDGTLIDVFTPRQRSRYFMGLEPIEGRGQLLLTGVEERRGDEFWEAQRADLIATDGDTLTSVVSPSVYRGATYRFDLRGRTVSGMARPHFRGRSLVIFVAPNRLLVSTGVVPELRWHDLSGLLTQVIRLDIPPEPVGEADVAMIYGRIDSTISEAEGDQRLIREQYRKNLDIPDFKAFWSNVVVDDSGFIWLLKPLPEETPFDVEVNEWRVLSPQGEYLGDVETPTAWGRFSRGRYLTYLTDPVSGAREAVVYEMNPAVPGLRYPD
ncbi:6-bladed beta-propeller [Gemmatimonadota bacterium]